MTNFLKGCLFGLGLCVASFALAAGLIALSQFGKVAQMGAVVAGLVLFFGWLNWRHPL